MREIGTGLLMVATGLWTVWNAVAFFGQISGVPEAAKVNFTIVNLLMWALPCIVALLFALLLMAKTSNDRAK